MRKTLQYNTNFTEYNKAIQFLGKGCKCGCSNKVPPKKFAQLRSDFQNLSKKEQDSFVMGQLYLMEEGGMTTSSRFPKRERTNQRFFYRWNNITSICQETYFNMLGISLKYFENIKGHLLDKGLTTRIHANTGKIPIRKTKMVVDQKVKETVKSFVLNYAKTHGSPNIRKTERANNITNFLPTEMTYKSVHNDFLNSLEVDSNLKQLKYRVFIKIWKQLTPQIGFMSPRSDLCDTCHKFRSEIHACKDEKEKATQKKNLTNT
jgi:hypothetical protein